MKRVIFTVIACALFSTTFAQFNQGRILAGGSVGFSSETDKSKTNSATTTNGKSTSIGFAPDAGYFVIDNVAVGIGLSVVSSSYKFEGSGDKDAFTQFLVTPFGRYYLDPGIFFQAAFGFGSQNSKDTQGSTTTEVKSNVTQWSLGAGYAYFLNDFVAVEPVVGYRSTSNKFKNTDNKGIDAGIFLNIGFQVYIGARN